MDGLPIQGAEVALSVFNQTANSWSLWDSQAFGQKNPQQTDAKGEYGFLVPPGKYRMGVSKWGFGTVKTQELQVENNYLINPDIPLTVETGLFNKIINYFIK